MKSPLLDFRERSVHRDSFLYGLFFGLGLGLALMLVIYANVAAGVIGAAWLLAAKCLHSRIPKKRRRKQVADAHPELPL